MQPARARTFAMAVVILGVIFVTVTTPAAYEPSSPSSAWARAPLANATDDDDAALPQADDGMREATDEGDVGQKYFAQILASCNASTFTLEEQTPGTLARRIKQADCGLGYDFRHSAGAKKHWTVVMYGTWEPQIMDLSGCLVGRGRCPWSHKCNIVVSKDAKVAQRADVVVIQQSDFGVVTTLAPAIRRNSTEHSKPYRVYYWREAVFTFIPVAIQKRFFDLEMGVHHTSGVLNPFYLFGPTAMMQAKLPLLGENVFVPPAERKGFMLSLISNCGHTTSLRQEYIDALAALLGASRLHQYGKCGTMHMPPKPAIRAAQIIGTYKFMLAMENTIMAGYTTEKLFMTMMMPVVVVYYGAINAPNITKTPSYIRASDFATPKALADYLLYLDAHDDEYLKYHAWRTDASQFDDYYLDMLSMRIPGPQELEPYYARKLPRHPRAAACCRLCDENYVKKAAATRQAKDLVTEKWRYWVRFCCERGRSAHSSMA